MIDEGSGGRGDRGFPSAAECSMPHSIAFGPSAAYVAGCAADCGWRDGWWSVWRRGHGGGGTGDVVSYFVHWSRAARPKLLQYRGCHKAAVMTEFTATRAASHPRTGGRRRSPHAATPLVGTSCTSGFGLAVGSCLLLQDYATVTRRLAAARTARSKGAQATWPMCQNEDNSALRGPSML